MSDDIKGLTKKLGDLNDQLHALHMKRQGVDKLIDEAIGPLKIEKDMIAESIKSVSSSINELSEQVARFELEQASKEIDNAKQNAIDAVRKYNEMFLTLRRNGKIADNDWEAGAFAIIRTTSPAAEEDGGVRAWLSAYDTYVVEYEEGWFPSEINC